MKRIAFVFLLLASPALADDVITSGERQFEFDPIAPPALVTWSVATADNRSVSLQVKLFGNNGGFTRWEPAIAGNWPNFTNAIGEELAAYCGMDFAAWRTALADAAYTRSIMQFGSVVQEQPLIRTGPASEFDLHHFLIFPSSYFWPNWVPAKTGIHFSGHELKIVPEPSTWLLVLMAMLAAGSCLRLPFPQICGNGLFSTFFQLCFLPFLRCRLENQGTRHG